VSTIAAARQPQPPRQSRSRPWSRPRAHLRGVDRDDNSQLSGARTDRVGPTSAGLDRAGLTMMAIGLAVLSFVHVLRMRALRQRLRVTLNEARHDNLTGLPNRRAALERLSNMPIGMIGLLDLDGFKAINDRYGHDVGDHVLTALAARLRAALADAGMIARLAGDEFVIIWTQRPHEPVTEAVRVLQQAVRPIAVHGHRLEPAASLGLALPGPGLHGLTLLAAADHAMYQAKNANTSNGARVHLYTAITPPGPIDRDTATIRRSTRHHPDGPFPGPDSSHDLTADGHDESHGPLHDR
jgi:diguanylate cyclase (GGDEF)-like protein